MFCVHDEYRSRWMNRGRGAVGYLFSGTRVIPLQFVFVFVCQLTALGVHNQSDKQTYDIERETYRHRQKSDYR